MTSSRDSSELLHIKSSNRNVFEKRIKSWQNLGMGYLVIYTIPSLNMFPGMLPVERCIFSSEVFWQKDTVAVFVEESVDFRWGDATEEQGLSVELGPTETCKENIIVHIGSQQSITLISGEVMPLKSRVCL